MTSPHSGPGAQAWPLSQQGAGRTAKDGPGTSWRSRAACKHLPPDIFFPIGRGPRAEAQTRLAKEVCSGCSVRPECLEFALAANMPYGVFGGMSEDERREARGRAPARYFGAGGRALEESA